MRTPALFLLLLTATAPLAGQLATRDWAPLDHLASRLVDEGWIPGVGMVVVDRDGELHRLAAGVADVDSDRPVTDETAFYIASSTKSFTALASVLFAARGGWSLADPIAKHLPRASWHEGVDPNAVTLEALLSHTSGISNDGPVGFRAAYTGEIDHDELLQALRLHGPIDRGFHYSNLGYNVVSLAIDERGTPWQDVLHETVFAPLGMHHTTARMSDVPTERLAMPHGIGPETLDRYPMEKSDRTMHAAGGMVTTTGDLGRWIRAQLGDGMLDGKQIFPAAVIRDTHRPRSSFSTDFLEIERVGYGLGWYTGLVRGDTLVHHFGGFAGYAAHVSFMSQRGVGVAVAINGGAGVVAMELLAQVGYAIASGDQSRVEAELARADTAIAGLAERRTSVRADRARRSARPQELPLPLEAYVGRYRADGYGEVRIGRWGERLRVVLGAVESDTEGYDVAKQRIRFEISSGSGSVGTFTVDGDRATAFSTNGIRFERVDP